MKCVICGQGFESSRKDAEFCSAKCRKRAERQRSQGVTDNDAVTDNVADKKSDMTPIWKKRGFPSREAFMQSIWKKLEQDKEKILKFSISKQLRVKIGSERRIIS